MEKPLENASSASNLCVCVCVSSLSLSCLSQQEKEEKSDIEGNEAETRVSNKWKN